MLKRACLYFFFGLITFSTHAQMGPFSLRMKPDHLGRFEMVKTTFATVPQDFKGIVQRPLQNEHLVANGVKLFALIATDYQTTNFFQKNIEPLDAYLMPYVSFPSIFDQTPFLRRWTRTVDGYMYTGVTAMYAAGFLIGNEKMQEASLLTTKAIVESYLVSHIFLKSTIARNRPARLLGDPLDSDRDSQYPFVNSPLDFFNWNGINLGSSAEGTGFPSYHATMFFAFASTMSRVYDNRIIPYSLATGALLYNIRGHNHWVSELVAGAVIGEFIGKVVYENYHNKRDELLSERLFTAAPRPKSKRYTTNFGLGTTFGIAGPQLIIGLP